jgi:hypothetical protein
MSTLNIGVLIAPTLAVPAELMNLLFFAFRIDVGLPDDAPWC